MPRRRDASSTNIAPARRRRSAPAAARREPAGRTGDSRRGPASGAMCLTRGGCSRAKRGYSTVVVLTLAVGIGSCTAVFSLVQLAAARTAAVPGSRSPRPALGNGRRTIATRTFIVSAAELPGLGPRDDAASPRSASGNTTRSTCRPTAEPEQVPGIRASSSLFDVLGVTPALGRVVHARRRRTGPSRRRHLRCGVAACTSPPTPAVIGREMRLNGNVYEVIGVMPPGFEFPRRGTGVWMPIAFTEQDQERGSHSFYVAGRLREGVTFEQARDEVERLGATLRERYDENADEGATVQRMEEFGLINTRAFSWRSRSRCTRPADRVRQRRQPPAGAGAHAPARVRDAAVTRRALLVTWRGRSGRRPAAWRLSAARPASALAWRVTRGVDLILVARLSHLALPRRRRRDARRPRPAVRGRRRRRSSALLFAFAPLVGLRRQSLQPMLREGDRGATRLAAGTRRALVAIGDRARHHRPVRRGPDDSQPLDAAAASTPDSTRERAGDAGVAAAGEYLRPAGARGLLRRSRSARSARVPGVVQVERDQPPALERRQRRPRLHHRRPAAAGAQRGRVGQLSADLSLVTSQRSASRCSPAATSTMRDVRDGEPVVIVNRAHVRPLLAATGTPRQAHQARRISTAPTPWLTVVGIVDNVQALRARGAAAARDLPPLQPGRVAGDDGRRQDRRRADAVATAGPRCAQARRAAICQLPTRDRWRTSCSGSVAWRETPMRLLTGFALVGLLLAGNRRLRRARVLRVTAHARARRARSRSALQSRGLIGLVLRQSRHPAGGRHRARRRRIAGVRAGCSTELLYEVEPGDPVGAGDHRRPAHRRGAARRAGYRHDAPRWSIRWSRCGTSRSRD